MATETIREFLVSLGYKQDEGALKKFEEGINKATKAVFSLAAAITGTATLVAAGIARFASNLEALYFAAQRTGSSATALKALDLAARNLGANAGEAQAAVEGLASALRTNPGNIGLLTGLLARLGYQLKVNADGSIDSSDALLKLSEVFKTMPYFQAKQFADLLGISEHTLYQLTRGNLLEEYRKALKELGPEWDQASRDAHQFMVDLRYFQTELEAFGLQVEHAIQLKLGVSLKSLRTWMEKNGPWLAQRVAEVAKQIIDAAQWIGEKIALVVGKLKEWDEETDGLSTKLIALAVLLKVTGAGSIIGGVLSLAGAFTRLAGAIGLVRVGMVGLAAYGGWKAGSWLNEKIDKAIQHSTGRDDETLGGWLYEFFHRGDTALRFFKDRGWSAAQAAGIVANLKAESDFSPTATGDNGQAVGIAQWHTDRQLDFKRLFGKDIRESSFIDQLNFVDWELRNRPEFGAAMLSASQTSADAARVFSNLYERPAGGEAEADRRARIAANINQQTTIHVDGAGDPQAVADRVAAQQRQVNAELARNFAPAVQ